MTVSENDWSATWNGTAVTISRPDQTLITFNVRAVAALKLAVSEQALLVATNDRKVLVLDLAFPGGRCVRMLTFKTAVTDMRSNEAVVALVMEDLNVKFYKLNQLTDIRIQDEK
jgi:hypothetical protein